MVVDPGPGIWNTKMTNRPLVIAMLRTCIATCSATYTLVYTRVVGYANHRRMGAPAPRVLLARALGSTSASNDGNTTDGLSVDE